jgi:glycosyltransferase involved in cell wall biosynthesis
VAQREDCDIVHFLVLDRSELAVLASLSLRAHRPTVFGTLFKPYLVHTADESVGPGRRLSHSASRLALSRLLEREMMRVLFVHSDRTKSLLLARLSGRIPSEVIAVVPDPAKDAPTMTKGRARKELGLPGDIPMILFFGGMRHDKGPDILLRALSALNGDWLAVLAGPSGGVGEREADACRRTLPAGGRLLTRFEFVPEHDADLYFRAADVVVLPYRRAFDGTSGVLQRAAAAGKTVIASDVGDVGPAAREAGLGIVVPPESPQALAGAMQDFLGRRDELEREVEPRALEYARAHDWRKLGAVTRACYLRAFRTRAADGTSPGVSA